MPAPCSYDYAIVRVVPRVEREEFVNAGVIVLCLPRDFLAARIDFDAARAQAVHPDVDVDAVRQHLNSIERICSGGPDSGPIGRLSPRERFDWLVSPRSTIIQTSPVHSGRCEDPVALMEHLLTTMVRTPADARR